MRGFLKAPFFPILFFYVAGLLLPPGPVALLAAAVFSIALFGTWIRKGMAGPWLCLVLLIFFLMGQRVQLRPDFPSDPSHVYFRLTRPRRVMLTGLVVSSPEILQRKTRLLVKSGELLSGKRTEKVSGLVRVSLYGPAPHLSYGDRVRFSSIHLSRPRNFRNPGGFDYVRHLRERGIYVTGWTGKKDTAEVLERGGGNRFLGRVFRVREGMEAYADKNMSPRNASLFKAMIFGKRGGLSPGDVDLFQKTGIAHLMAVSGLHIGFVACASYFLLDWLGIRLFIRFLPGLALGGWSARIAALASLFPVLFYAILVGDRVSSVRAAIMAGLFLGSIAIRKGHFHYHTLTTAALVILLWRPESLGDAGFHLSFCAVFFILFLLSQWLGPSLANYSPLTATRVQEFLFRHRRLSGYLLVTVAATIGTLPLIAWHFNRVSPYSVPVNWLAVPLATIIVTSGLFLSFLSLFFSHLATVFAWIPEYSILALIWVARGFSALPFSALRVVTPPPGLILGFYGAVIAMILLQKSLKNVVMICLCVLALYLLFPGDASRYRSGELSLTFLDVGQGDSAFLRFPNGKTMLIDGGSLFGDRDMGKWVVGPYLWDTGVRKVDYLVATHPDNDHIGGLLFILREFRVGSVLENGDLSRNKVMREIRRESRARGIPIKKLRAGDLVERDKVIVQVLNPEGAPPASSELEHEKENDLSLVLRIACGRFSSLFTGDIESAAEARLSRSGRRLRSTILKVPHHGSRSSSTAGFINAVRPEVAVISVGAHNRFGHPDPGVLKRYQKAGARLLRTDRCGAVEIFTNCETYRIKTSVPCEP